MKNKELVINNVVPTVKIEVLKFDDSFVSTTLIRVGVVIIQVLHSSKPVGRVL